MLNYRSNHLWIKGHSVIQTKGILKKKKLNQLILYVTCVCKYNNKVTKNFVINVESRL